MSVYGTYTNAIAVTPSDSNPLPVSPKPGGWAIYVGSAGDVKVRVKATQEDIVFSGALAGTIIPVTVDKVYATGTTASNLVGCY